MVVVVFCDLNISHVMSWEVVRDLRLDKPGEAGDSGHQRAPGKAMTRGENAYKEAKTAGMVARAGGDGERGKASGPGQRIHVETEEPRLVSRSQLQSQHQTGSSPH